MVASPRTLNITVRPSGQNPWITVISSPDHKYPSPNFRRPTPYKIERRPDALKPQPSSPPAGPWTVSD